jgi:hypothetical protein
VTRVRPPPHPVDSPVTPMNGGSLLFPNDCPLSLWRGAGPGVPPRSHMGFLWDLEESMGCQWLTDVPNAGRGLIQKERYKRHYKMRRLGATSTTATNALLTRTVEELQYTRRRRHSGWELAGLCGNPTGLPNARLCHARRPLRRVHGFARTTPGRAVAPWPPPPPRCHLPPPCEHGTRLPHQVD